LINYNFIILDIKTCKNSTSIQKQQRTGNCDGLLLEMLLFAIKILSFIDFIIFLYSSILRFQLFL